MFWQEADTIRRLLGLCAILLVLFGGNPPAQAASRSMPLDALGFENDVVVGSPHMSILFEFPVPRLAQIKAASATVFIVPNLQLNGNSTLFFYYNDKLIEKRTVNEIRQQNSILLKLPVDGTLRDSVRLQIKSNLFISNDLCRDDQSGGLFFTVRKNSFLNLSYDMRPVRTEEDFFGSLQQTLFIVVPQDATLTEIIPAAWTYGLMKKLYPHLDIQLVRAAELVKLPPVPRIWVSLDTKLPEYFKSKGTAPGITLADPNTLLISAADVQSLRLFVQQLSELPVFALDSTASKRIAIAPIETPSGTITEAVSFGSNSAREGFLRIPVGFQLYPTLLEALPERMGIHLEGIHTPGVVSSPVRMDVFLNNHLVHSSILDQGGPFRRDLALPDTVALRARNDLNVQFYYPEGREQCRMENHRQFAKVLPTSYLWGTGRHKFGQVGWHNIGLFLGKQGTILLDEALGPNTLKAAGGIVHFLNQQLPPGMAAFPNFLPLAQPVEAPEGAYILAVGLAENIPGAIRENLPVYTDKTFSVRLKATQASLFEQKGNARSVAGTIGEIKGKPLAVFSTNADGSLLIDALKYFGQPKIFDSLNGNVLVYQQPNQVYSFAVAGRSLNEATTDQKDMLADLWNNNRMLIQIAAGLLVFLILLFIFNQKPLQKQIKRKTTRSDPADKLFK